jgi:hypothetical protein
LTVEQEIHVLNIATKLGLSSMYDAPRDTYSNWRTKVLTFAQQIMKEKHEQTIRSDINH